MVNSGQVWGVITFGNSFDFFSAETIGETKSLICKEAFINQTLSLHHKITQHS